MSCPNLDSIADALAGSRGGEIADHIGSCAACRAAVELMVLRAEASARAGCERAELLLALADDGGLGARDRAVLDAHLATCPACAALVEPAAPPAPPAAMALPSIDPAAYDLGPEIARGGMGRIRAAHDRRIGRPVVVKELIDKSPALAARFEREARVTARLQHPGIVPIYEIGTWPDGTPFYAMRRVIGRTLREALADAADLPARLALLPALVTAAEAVAFAHGRGIVHRDLTPANIVVGDYGETVVIDWGLAKELDAAVSDDAPADVRTPDTATDVTLAPDDHSLAGAIDHVAAGATAGSSDRVLTRPGDILGTAAYMPPEQAAGASVDRRADVYALGALLYNLLAGATPYQGSTAEILVQLRAGAPLATTPDLEGAPRDLVSIARKAMARVPADRYADAAAFVAELRRFTAGQVVGAHQYSTGEALRRWFRKHRVLAAAMIAGVAAGAIAVAAILDARDAALEERHRTEFLLARVRADEGNHLLATGHTWLAALELADAVRLGADTPGIRRSLAEAMRGIDSMIVHTPHTPRREYAGGPTQFDAIAGAAFSPDGRALVVSTYEGFDIYATADGRPLASGTRPEAWATETPRDGNRRPAGKVRYTPDGRYLVNNEAWPAIRAGVWDAATGELLVARMAPDGYHFTGTRSADGMIAELGRGNDGPAVGALDLRSDTVIAASADILTFPAPTELAPRCDPASLTGELAEAASAGRCGRSLDGRTVATLARGELALWDAATGARLQTTPLRAATTTPVFVDHDRHLFLSYPREIGGGDLQVTGRVEIRDLQTGELIDELQGNAVALSADRLRVAVQPAQRGVVVAALDREPALATFDRAAHGLDRTLAVNTKGTTIVGVVADGTLRAFDLLDGRARSLPVLREPAAMSRDGRRLIGTRADGALDVVEIATGLVVRMIAPSSHAPVQAVALDPTGDTALVLHTDAISDVWSIATGGHTQFSDTHADHHVGSENILACHRTGGRPRYDLVTKFEDEVDPTPPHCETATDDAAVAVQAPARFHHLDIRGAKVYVEEVTIDGYQLEARTPSFWTNVAVDLPAPPIRIAATRDLVASGVATWTLHGAEVGRRRQLAAPEREVWFTPDRKRLVIVDALGNVSVWDQHLETRTGDELVAALRARIGLEIVDGMILADEPEDERAHWRTATARGWSSISPAVP